MKRFFSTFALPITWAALILVWAFRLRGHFPAFLDTLDYVYPEKWVNTSEWAAGQVPLWNPWIACGTPHLAQCQPACFYPPFLLWVWTGLPSAFFPMALLHTAWALVGFFLWSRWKGARPTVAWLGAGSFAFGAMAVIYWGFITHLATVSWIPWIFLAADAALEKKGTARWAVFSIALALQALAGYAFFCLFTYAPLAAYLAFGRRTDRRQWGAFAAASLFGFLLSAVQILPFLDYCTYASRPLGDLFALRPGEWRTILWPDLLGIPGLTGYQGVYGHFIFNPYFGLVPLAGFLLALSGMRSGRRFFPVAALAAMAFVAGIPFIPAFLEPAKASPIFVFLALSAGTLYWSRRSADPTERRPRRLPKWLLWAGAALWVLDMAWVPFRVVPLVGDPFRDPAVIRDAGNLRLEAGEGRLLFMREKESFYPPGVSGSPDESFKYRARWAVPNVNAVWGIRSFDGYLSNYLDGQQNVNKYLSHGLGNERLADAAGVRAVEGPPPPPYPKYQVQRTLSDIPVTRNAGALPIAWRAPFVKEFPDRPALITALMDPSAFLEQEVYTEKSPSGGAVRLPAPERSLAESDFGYWNRLSSLWGRLWGGGNTVTPERLSPCREVFTADFRDKGWMVWSESYAPGWRAWVDGSPQVIFRADGLFMAVPVRLNGLHRVEFRYEPTAFRVGLFLSLFALSCLAALGLSLFRAKLRWKGARR